VDLPEMGLVGEARVLAVGPCPAVAAGAGRVVTAAFRHRRGEVLGLWVGSDVLRVTAGHPVWCADRSAWVPAGELVAGERVLTAAGTQAVFGTEAAARRPVYNLEVDADHCYRAGEQEILVHNASALAGNVQSGVSSVLTDLGCCAETKLVDLSQGWRSTSFASKDLAIIYLLRDGSSNQIMKAGKTTAGTFIGRWDDYEKAARLSSRKLVLDIWVFSASCVSTIEEAEKKVRSWLERQSEALPWDNTDMRLKRRGPGTPGAPIPSRWRNLGDHWNGEHYVLGSGSPTG
jgi:hypothetical protein